MLKIGDKVGDYTLDQFIGSGGYGVVWRARDPFGKIFALKIFHESVIDDVKLFLEREYDEVKKLIHSNIIVPLAVAYHQSIPFLILKLCDGNLNQLMNQRIIERKKSGEFTKPLFSEMEIAKIIRDIGSALVFLHSRRIIHNDIKPSNILYKNNDDGSYSFFISDFGTSFFLNKTIRKNPHKATEDEKNASDYGLSLGYAAPEVYQNKPEFASDVFSLGVTIYELISGELPSKTNNFGLGYLLTHGGSFSPLSQDTHPNLNKVLYMMLEKKAIHRPSAEMLMNFADSFILNGEWRVLQIPRSTDNEVSFASNFQKLISGKSGEINSYFSKIGSILNVFKKQKLYFIVGMTILVLLALFFTANNSEKIDFNERIQSCNNLSEYNKLLIELNTISLSNEDLELRKNISYLSRAVKKYSYIGKFKNGFTEVHDRDKKGVINLQFKIVIPVEFQDIRYLENIYFVKDFKGKWGAYYPNGEQIFNNEYARINFSKDFKSLEAKLPVTNEIITKSIR